MTDNGRQRVIEVFGDACPVCSHSVTGEHDALEHCTVCGRSCADRHWPPESVQRYQEYHHRIETLGVMTHGEAEPIGTVDVDPAEVLRYPYGYGLAFGDPSRRPGFPLPPYTAPEVFRCGSPKNEEAAAAAYLAMHGEDRLGESAHSAIREMVEHGARVRIEREEAAIRDELTRRARANIEQSLEGHRGVNPMFCDHVYDTAAAAAVDAFADYYRERRQA